MASITLWLYTISVIWVVCEGLICKEGTAIVTKNGKCLPCPRLYYKDIAGNHPCERCGRNSKSTGSRIRCPCREGYMRKLSDQKQYSTKCHSLKPRNIQLWRVPLSNSVRVIWDAVVQLDDCGGEEFDYIVHKKIGSSKIVHKIKAKSNVVTLTNLRPNSRYAISVTTDGPILRNTANDSRTSTFYFFTENSYNLPESDDNDEDEDTMGESSPMYADTVWLTITPPLTILVVIIVMATRMYSAKQLRRENSNKYFITKSYQIDHEDHIIKQMARMKFTWNMTATGNLSKLFT